MSTEESNVEQQTQTEEQTPPETPPSPQSTGATEEFRYGDDAPEYLRGKNPQETLAFVNNLVQEVQQAFSQQQQQPATPQPTQESMQPQTNAPQLPNADEALTDPAVYQQKLAAYLQYQTNSQLASAAAPIVQQLASQARDLSQSDPKNKEIWDKYGSEVDRMVQGVPAHLRTKDLYNKAIVMVRGEHIDELAAARAEKLAAANPGVKGAGSSGAGDTTEPSGDVWDEIADTPIGKATIDAIGRKGIQAAINKGIYKSPEDYLKHAKQSKVKINSKSKQELYTRG